ncbi:MAG: 50S ribosomal protein L35 [Armatimonadetes bacterium]|nr:50S ribosomal protein L35 [Armatimonadota bacterium]
MPKVKAKTRKAAAKRFKITGTGKVLFKKAGRSHLLSKKTSKRKRSLRRLGELTGRDAKRARRMVPHG